MGIARTPLVQLAYHSHRKMRERQKKFPPASSRKTKRITTGQPPFVKVKSTNLINGQEIPLILFLEEFSSSYLVFHNYALFVIILIEKQRNNNF
jgi:hypothetical protein